MSEFDRPLAATHHSPERLAEPDLTGGERVALSLGGGALFANGLRRGGVSGWLQVAAGVMLAAHAATGRSPLKRATEASPWERDLAKQYGWRNAEAIQRSVTIARPRSEVFATIHDTKTLASVLSCVERIEPTGEGTDYRWTLHGLMGRKPEWTVRLEEATPNERLVWISESGCPFEHRFTLTLVDAPHGRGTEIRAVLACQPPAGRVGYAAASLVSPFSGRVLSNELRRIKQYLETGEVSSSGLNPLQERQANGDAVPGPGVAQAGFGGAA